MTMTSYAQNGEDVMLMRALGNVAGGFYIDVGAADPTIVSVTRAFYERGWNGINVEPTTEHHRRLNEARPRDLNLSQPVSDHVAEELFYFCEHSDLSTLLGDVAAMSTSGGLKSESRIVQTTTLAEICRRFAPPVIHFLKVDVEGAEESVLRGADFQRYRPWIVVVEATLPNTQIPAHATWEPVLLENQYRFTWFDGLNRFYLAEEKFDTLCHHFNRPINIFDDYVRFDPGLESLAAELAAARAALEPLREAAVAAENRGTAAASDARMLAEAAVSRAEAADSIAALLDARMRSSDALAQTAAANAQAADAQVSAAKERLSDLQHEIDDTRRRYEELRLREEATQSVLAARQSEAAARLAFSQLSLEERTAAYDRACAEREAERARASTLDAQVTALRHQVAALADDLVARDALPQPPVETIPPVGEIIPASVVPLTPPKLSRKVSTKLYAWTLRPFLRPLAWRGRSFLLAGVRQALDERASLQLGPTRLEGEQAALLMQIRSRQDRILDMVHRVDDLAAEHRMQQTHVFADLRARTDDAVKAARSLEAALPQRTGSELAGLAASMEAALLTLASAGRPRAQ